MKAVVAIVLAVVASALAQQECGVPQIEPNPEGRIVNGIEATPNSWPWQVAMCRGTGLSCSLICGATIIRNDILLTAAHCIVGQSSTRVGYKFGAHSLRSSAGNGQGIVRVERFVSDPRYDSNQITSDIGIVRLATPLTFGEKVQPICLANTDDHLAEGTQIFDIGWGRLGGNAAVSDTLQQTILVHHDRATCGRLFSGLGHTLDETVSCAGGLGDLKSVCFGDSGGPYFKQDSSDNRYYQYGINSFVFSRACAQEGRPNGFSRVPALCNFLQGQAGLDGICITPPESATKFHAVGQVPKILA